MMKRVENRLFATQAWSRQSKAGLQPYAFCHYNQRLSKNFNQNRRASRMDTKPINLEENDPYV